jgi:hypothetical protein
MQHFRLSFGSAAALSATLFLAGYIINIAGF